MINIDKLREDLKIVESISNSFSKINYSVEYNPDKPDEYNTYEAEMENFTNALDVITNRIEKALHKKELELLDNRH